MGPEVSGFKHLIRTLGITSTCSPGRADRMWLDEFKGATHWTVVFRFGRKRLTCGYSQGPACEGEPKTVDVLGCLVMDAAAGNSEYTFEEFCSNFGYDTDSRKAEKIYKACARMNKKLKQFLGEHYEMVCEAGREY